MSAQIDERVVEMRFDNDDFEKNARRTMSTLEQLKSALNMSNAVKSFDDISKKAGSVDLSGLEKTAQFLEKRFSVMGTAVHRVVENVTDEITSKVGSAFSFVTDNIVKGGLERAQNVENARFQLQSLLRDEEQVQGIMDAAMDTVNGTAYGFDVAAKAASMFAASGITDINQIHDSLMGMANATAAVNGDYESMSRIFSKIAGQGRLMGDELNQLATQGMNPAAMIAKYIRDIGEVANVTEADVRKMVSEGKIDFELFYRAMNYNFEGAAKRANETLNGSFANLKAAFKKIGEKFYAPLVAQNSEVVKLLNVLRVKVNEFKDAVSTDDEENGIISLTTRMSSAVLDLASKVSDFVEKIDIKNNLEKIRKGTNITINLFKALQSVVTPVTDSIEKFFKRIKGDLDLNSTIDKVEKFTSTLRLSDEASKNLETTITGILDVFHAVGYVVSELAKVVFPDIGGSTKDFGGYLLEVTAYVGELLSKFSAFVESSETMRTAIQLLGKAITLPFKIIGKLASGIKDFIEQIDNLGYSERIVKSLGEIFGTLRGEIGPLTVDFDGFGDSFGSVINEGAVKLVGMLADALESISKAVREADFSKFNDFANTVKEAFLGISSSVESFKDPSDTFGKSSGSFLSGAKELNTAAKILEIAKTKLETFFTTLRNNITASGIFAVVGSVAMIATTIKMSKALEKLGKTFMSFNAIPAAVVRTLGGVSGVLRAYQKEINAKTVIKVAEAIAILAGSLILMSNFGDTKKMLQAAAALSIVAGTFMFGFAAITAAMHLGEKTSFAINTTADVLRASLYNITSGIKESNKIMAIGRTFQKFGTFLLMVVGSLVAVAAMYINHANEMDIAFNRLKYTFIAVVGAVTALTLLSSIPGIGKGVNKLSGLMSGVGFLLAGLAGLLTIFVAFLNTPIPTDYSTRIGIITSLLIGLTGIITTFAVLAKFTGTGTYIASVIPTVTLLLALSGVMKALTTLLAINMPADADKRIDLFKKVLFSLEGVIAVIAVSSIFKKSDGMLKGAKATLSGIATTLFGMVGALYLLLKMKLPEDGNELKQKLGILIGILVAVGGVVAVLELVAGLSRSESGIKGAAGAIIAMSFFLVTAIGSLLVLSILPLDRILEATKVLRNILIALGLALAGAGMVHDPSAGKAVLAMVASITAITMSLSILSMIDLESLKNSAIALSGVLIALALTFSQIGQIQMKSAPAAVLAMVVETVAIVGALMILSNYNWTNLLTASAGLSATLIGLSIAINIISKSKNNNTKILKLFLESVSLLISITTALALLSSVNTTWGRMIAASVGLSATLIAVSYAFKILSERKDEWKLTEGTGRDLLEALGLLLSIAISIGILSSVNTTWGQMIAASVGLSATLIAVSYAFKILSERKDEWKLTEGTGRDLLEALGLLLSIAISIGILSSVNTTWGQMIASAISMSIMLIALAGCFKIVDGTTGDITAIATFLLMTLSLIPICAALAVLSKFKFDNMMEMAVSISTVLLAMSAAFAIVTLIGSLSATALPGIGSFLLFTLSLIPVCAALIVLSQFKLDGVLEIAASISVVLLSLSAALAIVSVAGLLAAGAIPGIAVLILFIASMTLLITGIGAMMNIDGYKKLIQDGGEGLYLIGQAIGKFVGGIVDGVSIGAAKALENIGDGLAGFMENAKPFFDGLSQLPDGFLGSVVALAAAVTTITATTVIDGIQKWITGKSSIVLFAQELSNAGPNLVAFANSVKGLDDSALEATKNAAGVLKVMSDLAKALPNSGGLVSLITGDNRISTFAAELVIFGPLMRAYSISVSGMNTEAVEASAAAASMLSTLAKNLPNQGGIVSWFTGDNRLSVFGAELAVFGPLLRFYAACISGMDDKAVIQSASAAMMLSTMARNLPNQGGIISWFTGDNTLSKFGKELVKFGPLLRIYSWEIKGMDSNAVKASGEAARVLAELAKNLPRKQVLIEKIFAGDKSLSAFGKELVKFGGELAKYNKKIKDIDASNFYKINNGIRTIIEMLSGLDSVNFDNVPKFIEALGKLGDDSIAEFVKAFDPNTSGIITAINEFFDEARCALDRYSNVFELRGQLLVGQFIDGFGGQEAKQSITKIADELCRIIFTEITKYGIELYRLGNDITKQIAYGMNDRVAKDQLKDVTTNLVRIVAAAIVDLSTGTESPIYLSGMYMASGLIEGAQAASNIAYTAGTIMGESYKDGLFEFLGIHSPALVGINAAGYTADGIYVGSTSKGISSKMYKSGTALGVPFVSGLNDSVSNASTIAEVAGQNAGSSFNSGVNNGLTSNHGGSIPILGELSNSSHPAYNQGYVAGQSYNKGVLDGLDSSTVSSKGKKQPLSSLDKLASDLKAAGKEIPEALNTAITQVSNNTNYQATVEEKNHILEQLYGSIGSAVQSSSTATSSVTNKIKTAAEQVISPWKQALIDKFGENFGDAFKSFSNNPNIKNVKDNASKLLTDMFGGAVPDLSNLTNGINSSLNTQLENSLKAMTVSMPEIGYNYGIAVNTIQKTNKKAIKNQDKFWGTMLEIQKAGINGAKYESYDYLQYENEIVSQANSILDNYSNAIASDTKSIMNQVGLFDAVKTSINETAKAIKDQIGLFDEVTSKTKANRKAIMDQIGLFDSVANANKDKANSIMNQVGLFDAATAKNDEVTKESIVKNLTDQLTQYKEYRSIIYSLKKRIKDEDLIAYLSDLGVSSINELRAIYNMTDSELNKYISLFQEKYRISEDIAADQISSGGEVTKETLKKNLEDQIRLYTEFKMNLQDAKARIQNKELLNLLDGMTVSNLDELKALNSMTNEELDEYIKLIEAKSAEAGEISMISGDTIESTKQSLIDNLNDQVDLYGEFYKNLKEMRKKDKNGDLSELLSGMTVNSIDELKALNAMTEEELEAYLQKYREKWEKSRKIAKEQEKLANEQSKITKRDILNNQKDQIKLYKDFKSTYTNVMSRIADPQLQEYIKDMGIDQIDTLKAIESMTEDELNQFVTNFQKKQKICYDIAKEGNKGLAAEASAQLSELFGGVDVDVEKFMKQYDGTIDSITTYVFNRIKSTSDTESLASTVGVFIGAFDKELLAQQKTIEKTKKKIVKNSKSTKKTAKEAGTELGQEVATGVESSSEEIKKSGKKASDSYVEGVKKNVTNNEAKKAGKKLSNQGVEGANSVEDVSGKWTKAGKHAANGFIRGIMSRMDQSTAAGRKIAQAALKAAMEALDEHSPSRKFMMVGDFAGLAFVMSLLSYASEAENAGTNLGSSAIRGIQDSIQLMNNMINDGYDITPVITPVVDMGSVYTSASEITDLFNSSLGLTSANMMDTYGAFLGMKRGENDMSGQNEGDNGNTQNISFTQNNYSPKELSRIEIYRQTRNQLAQLKGV